MKWSCSSVLTSLYDVCVDNDETGNEPVYKLFYALSISIFLCLFEWQVLGSDSDKLDCKQE